MAVCHFEVVHVVIEAGEHDGDVLVESLATRNAFEVFGLDVAAQVRVSATAVRDAFGVEFLFHSALTKYVDLVLGAFELEDAGDVDGGAVGGAEDFFLLWVLVAGKSLAKEKCPHIPLTR